MAYNIKAMIQRKKRQITLHQKIIKISTSRTEKAKSRNEIKKLKNEIKALLQIM